MNSPTTNDDPFVFEIDQTSAFPLTSPSLSGRLGLVAATRALQGMQKEAIIRYGHNGPLWRIICDEGPWLNGTDMAPFPLGFFNAGLVASYLSEYREHARQRGVVINDLEVMVDTRYRMEGSLLKGTMQGSALPVQATFKVQAEASEDVIRELAWLAVATSPADAFLREAHPSIFDLVTNDEPVLFADDTGINTGTGIEIQSQDELDALFDRARPNITAIGQEDILHKLEGVTHLGGEELGTVKSSTDVGLSDNQKRELHVRGVGEIRADGMKSIQVACFSPVGSVFRVLSDDSAAWGGAGRAPSGLAYLSAGLSFCFMTQLGRYAQVAKQRLNSYQIVQHTSFDLPWTLNAEPAPSTASSTATKVFLCTEEEKKDTLKMLKMGEQTCYLHAAGRTALKTHILVQKV